MRSCLEAGEFGVSFLASSLAAMKWSSGAVGHCLFSMAGRAGLVMGLKAQN